MCGRKERGRKADGGDVEEWVIREESMEERYVGGKLVEETWKEEKKRRNCDDRKD